MEKIITKTRQETIEFARNFASKLNNGDIVLLCGDLGAGKTVIAKGIVDYFSNGKVNAVSPTFVLVNTYETNPQINHFDLYRLNNVDELVNIGFEEILDNNSIIKFIEWPEKAKSYLPAKYKKITVVKLGNKARNIILEDYT